MKTVVIGGTGNIGSKLVPQLAQHGHDTVAAAPTTGVNTLTGEGLTDALAGASVVIDVSNSPSFEDSAVMRFFETSTRNLLADEATAGGAVRLAPVFFRPIAGDDVAQAVGRISTGSPVNGMVDVAGPERFRMDEFFRQALAARNDPREVVTDPHAHYFGAELSEGTLVPGSDAILGETRYSDWLGRTAV